MPNDTLDEIEARLADAELSKKVCKALAYIGYPKPVTNQLSGLLHIAEEAAKVIEADAAALIEMVRARDRESAWRPIKELPDEHHHGAWVRVWVEAGVLYAPDGGAATHYLLFPPVPLAALDTPPAQEPTE